MRKLAYVFLVVLLVLGAMVAHGRGKPGLPSATPCNACDVTITPVLGE